MLNQVSVVIPAYNGAAFLAEALQSVLGQSRRPREIIVVDDASQDSSAKLVAGLALQSPVPVRLICLAHNTGGPAEPANVGIQEATGDFIAVLDQDDVFLPGKLDRQARILEADPAVGFAFSLCALARSPERPLQLRRVIAELQHTGRRMSGWHQVEGRDAFELFLREGNVPVGFPGFLFRRRDWERRGGMNAWYRILADLEFLLWLCLQGPVGFIPEVQYLRRLHDHNLSSRTDEKEAELRRIRAHYGPCRQGYDDPARSLRAVQHQVA